MENDLEKLFNPASIAIIGASEKEGKVGNVIAKNILTLGYQGRVFLINPNHEKLLENKCYASLDAIGEPVDLAIITIPADLVLEIIQKSARFCKNFVIVSAGFSEIGKEGRIREAKVKEFAVKNNLNILGPNCLGFINPSRKLNASFAGGMPEPGNIALVSQSGALAVAIMDMAKNEGLGFSKIISIGNKAEIGEEEIANYLKNDQETKVVGIYLEGIKNGSSFVSAFSQISSQKTVIILKAGITEKSQQAITSHTGALAGADEITNAAFEKAGIIRAENLENFVSLIKSVSFLECVANNEVIVVTNAGGPGVLTADAFRGKRIKLAEISAETKTKMKELLPKESSVENPIDLLGDAQEDRYEKVLAEVEKERASSVIVVLTPQDQTPVREIAEKIIKYKKNTAKSVLAVFIGNEKINESVKLLNLEKIPVFLFPEQAVASLEKYFQWCENKNNNSNSEEPPVNIGRMGKVAEIIKKAIMAERKALLFFEAKELLGLYNIPVIDAWNKSSLADAVFPVAVKVDSDKILHKTEKQGVMLNIRNKKDLAGAVGLFERDFPGENILIQPMLEIKTELIIGIKRDPVFGPVAVFGLGGIYTEIFKAADFIIPPMRKGELKSYLEKDSKLNFLFNGFRGQKKYDAGEIADIILGMLKIAREAQEIREFDINPLLAYNDGRKAVAVDIKIMID